MEKFDRAKQRYNGSRAGLPKSMIINMFYQNIFAARLDDRVLVLTDWYAPKANSHATSAF